METYGLNPEELAKCHRLLSNIGVPEEQHEWWMKELHQYVASAFDLLFDEYSNPRDEKEE